MSELEVQVVHLPPLRVASALGFGPSPELLAWTKILTWGQAKGLLADMQAVRFFGFDNPCPSPGSPNYGYEQWMTVGPEVQAEGEVEIKEFPGGVFAVARCRGVDNINATWRRLVAWVEDSPYRQGSLECLEECLNPGVKGAEVTTRFEDLVFDLYESIVQ